MARSDQFEKVRWEAAQLLSEQKITSLPINPFTIATRLGILLKDLPPNDGGASGMLIHLDGEFCIAYPTHINSDGFKRFSVSHELGHYRLPGHYEALVEETGRHVSRAGFRSGDRYEQEADHFAAALLMPTELFSKAMRKAGEGLAAIESLSGLCKTSLEATAIRYSQCTYDPFAVLRSEGSFIEYCIMSSTLKDFSGLNWIKKNTPLPAQSVTAAFNSDPENVKNVERETGPAELQDWFSGPHQQTIKEEVIGLGSYGKTLTILTEMEPPDEVEEEDEALEDSWTPRF